MPEESGCPLRPQSSADEWNFPEMNRAASIIEASGEPVFFASEPLRTANQVPSQVQEKLT